MAYTGYLVKVGNYTIPFRFIESNSYKCGIKGQDLDSFQDANGILDRNALVNKVIKMEFEVPTPFTEADNRTLMDSIYAQYTNTTEKKASVKAFMPEIGSYVTMDCYVPDVEYTVEYADENEIEYSSVRLAFIGYGGAIG